ncbi:MAG: acetyl-CoA carboxylase, carboxyltransferase subunit beta [Gemmiger sp.]|nr:acetyl-CoA carboxylase, carboxyltransferase subunit beta [Gemmiger sp.]
MPSLMKALSAAQSERTFALKARREAVGNAPVWQEPVFVTCPQCGRRASRPAWANSLYVCPNCGQYQPIGGYYRLSLLFDHGSFRELEATLPAADPLQFPGYSEKLALQKRKTGLEEAVVAAYGRVDGLPVVAAVLDSRFFMGSMGSGVGEKVTRAVELATAKKLPLLIFSASGGARMQEGIFSLMQMAKTSAAVARHSSAGLLFISYLTHPTTGGVIASFASLGDITLAEPGALIGFAGPRVIEQTIGQKLPAGFQRSEFQQTHGFVDALVPRTAMKATVSQLLKLHPAGGRRL